MKNILIVVAVILFLLGAFYVSQNKEKVPVVISQAIINLTPEEIATIKIQGKTCYAYHQEATLDAPYAVDEYINITITGNNITGIKKGTQSGPDMTNGYTGTLKGTVDKTTISTVFSYTIEGSNNSEKEIYNIVSNGLEKLRYPLKEEEGTLVPDTTKEYKTLSYNTIDCAEVK